MKYLVLFLFILFQFSCSSPKPDLTDEEFLIKIKEAEESNLESKKLTDGWYQTMRTENEYMRVDPMSSKNYYINPKPIILPINFWKAEEFEHYDGSPGLSVRFEKSGTDAWSKATGQNIMKPLIYIFNNEIISAPTVNSQIRTGNAAFHKAQHSEREWAVLKQRISEVVDQNKKRIKLKGKD